MVGVCAHQPQSLAKRCEGVGAADGGWCVAAAAQCVHCALAVCCCRGGVLEWWWRFLACVPS